MAARLLQRAPRTEAELDARLQAKGYAPETAQRTVARCRELGWVGDAMLAHDRARTLRRRGAGCLRIAADLEARGVPERLIADAVQASRDGSSEAACARQALARAGVIGGQAWRWLAARGFPEEVIDDVLS